MKNHGLFFSAWKIAELITMKFWLKDDRAITHPHQSQREEDTLVDVEGFNMTCVGF